MNNSQNKLTVLACGGAGINVAYTLENLRGRSGIGIAALDIYYLDVNNSNLANKKVGEGSVYIFPGTKPGSGGDRKTNAKPIGENTAAAIQFCKPGDWTVVIHSASGGSGSVIGPNIVSALLAKKKNVVVVMIGDTESGGAVQNSLTLFKNYDSIADTVEAATVMAYFENSETQKKQEVNRHIFREISLLAALFSGQHESLDPEDIANFLNPGRFSKSKPQLLSLEICTTPDEIKAAGDILGVITLATADMYTGLKTPPAYQKVGFVPDEWKKPQGEHNPQMIGDTPIHYVVSASSLTAHVKRLAQLKTELEDTLAARNPRKSFFDQNDTPEKSGLIFD